MLRWLSAKSSTPRVLFASTALVTARKEVSVPPQPDKSNSSKVLSVHIGAVRAAKTKYTFLWVSRCLGAGVAAILRQPSLECPTVRPSTVETWLPDYL